jgi:hypothetical protein
MTKSQIQTYLSKLDWLFGCQHYTKELIIKKENEDNLLADIKVNHQYQTLQVNIYPFFFKETENEQRKCLLHELCHTITSNQKMAAYSLIDGTLITKTIIDGYNEQATSQIENIIWGFINKNFSKALKDL